MQTENQETPKTELQLAQEKIASLEKQVEDLKKSMPTLTIRFFAVLLILITTASVPFRKSRRSLILQTQTF
ncbi:hypothetical protein [Treponema peruense]|uniref:hypothetical protein n=1 Tax=Treponema peruense TaxID=2787628 RepID=UPI001E438910|nr:hypothetical protein [Treponema peruense]